MRKISGIISIIAIFVWSISSSAGPHWQVFFGTIPAMIVIGVSFGFLLTTSSNKQWRSLWQLLCGKKRVSAGHSEVSNEQAQALCNFLQSGSRVALATGFLGCMIGFISMMMVLDDPSSIGPKMATSILSALYGAILADLVFKPGYLIAAKRFGLTRQTITQNDNMHWLYIVGCLGIITCQMAFVLLIIKP